MMKEAIIAAVFVVYCCLQSNVDGHKILGIFPSSSRSHYIIGSELMKGLAVKGHEVSVITAFPLNEGITNYEEIPIPGILKHFQGLHESLQHAPERNIIEVYLEMIATGRTVSELALEQPAVQELLNSSNRTFDLIVCEIFVNEALYGFAQHFNAPIIGLCPTGNSVWASSLTGSPIFASFMPNIFLGNTDRMNFFERLLNLVALTVQQLGMHLKWLPYQAEVYNKFFPNATVTLSEVLRNFSLVLMNQHISIGNSEPLVNSMIEVGGFHIQKNVKSLPQKIKDFLDNAVHGAIYFSMGTNWKSGNLPKDKLEAFVKTFSSLKQRIIWKYENSSLPGKSDNILISNWLPQNEILAHPNVKLFISHGGLLGTNEAIYYGKPLLGIPMLCDQFMNMARAVQSGYALKIPYTQLSEMRLKTAIKELLSNPQYTQEAMQVSVRYRDQPMDPLEKAVYWVEYVLRHKGAPHLRSVALDLNFIQYHSLDTIGVLYGSLLLVVLLLGKLLRTSFSSLSKNVKSKKE